MSNVDVKIIVLGAEYCGKTSLIDRFLKEKFDGENEYQNTIGVLFGSKVCPVGDRTLVVGVWDTAGSERYQSVSRIYYRGAKVAIVCYDVTDKSSWEKLEHWVDELRTHEDSCRIYICGNKMDLLTDDNKRKIEYQKVLDFAEEISERRKPPVKVYETSSKTGENVEDVFNDILKDFLDDPHNSLTEFNKTLKLSVDCVDSGKKKSCCSN